MKPGFLGLGLIVLGSLTATAAQAQTDLWGQCPLIRGSFSCMTELGAPYFISYTPSVSAKGAVVFTNVESEADSDGSRKVYAPESWTVGQTVHTAETDVRAETEDSFQCTDQKLIVTHVMKTKGKEYNRIIDTYSIDQSGFLIKDTQETHPMLFTAVGPQLNVNYYDANGRWTGVTAVANMVKSPNHRVSACAPDAAGNLISVMNVEKPSTPVPSSVNENGAKVPAFANTFDEPGKVPSVTTDGFVAQKPI